VWLTLFRLAVVTVLFAATLLFGVGTGLPSEVQSELFVVTVAGFGATVVFALVLRKRRFLLVIAYTEITCDVALAGALVYLTGASSIFSFMFILAVANGSLLLFRRGALVAATLSSVCFAFIRIGLRLGWMRDPTGFANIEEPTSAVAFPVSVNLAGTFLAAALASYLSEQVRTKGEELTAKEKDYDQLAQLHRSILESISSGIATIDPSGCIDYVNRAGMDICHRWFSSDQGPLPSKLFCPA
jgi:two-component system sensor histidine kinase PilS (NtrC family)